MKSFIIAKSNMKKNLSSMILIFVLITIASMLLYTGINVNMSINKFMDKRNEEQNGADSMVLADQGHSSELNKIFQGNEAYDYSEEEETLLYISAGVRDVTIDSEKENTSVILLPMDKDRKISHLDILNKGSEVKDNSIVLPAYLNLVKGYQVGDEIEIITGDKTHTFEVYGFSEDVMFSSPTNITMFKLYVSDNMIKELKENDASTVLQTLYKIKTKDSYSSKEYEDYISTSMTKEISDGTFKTNFLMNYEVMKMGTGVFVNIMMSIISIFSVIIVVISLIVIRYSINSDIESNIHNMGMLEAVGYTVRQLRNTTILSYFIISASASLVGLSITSAISGFIGNIISLVLGMTWYPSFNPIIFLMTLIVVNVSIVLVVSLSTLKYKGITPLVALRSGINTHNFKRNYLPLNKTRLGINSALGIKGIMHNKKQNISMAVIITLLAFTCIVSLGIYFNFAAKDNVMVKIVGIEKPDIMISSPGFFSDGEVERIYEIFDEVKDRDDVEDTLYESKQKINIVNGDNTMGLDLDIVSDFDKLKVSSIIEGRMPVHDNEIVVTDPVAKRLEAGIGDTIYVEVAGQRKDFIIVGINQQIIQLGINAKISEDGMKRVYKDFKPNTLFVYLKDGSTSKEVVEELKTKYGDENMAFDDFNAMYNSILDSINSGIALLSVVCLSVTLLVIILILFMLIKMKLLKEKRMYGIYKALGYTSWQLMWQTTMNFAPVISVGALLGIIMGRILVNPILVVILSMSGIKKCYLEISPMIFMGSFLFITVMAFIISMVLSRRVKKIEAYRMIVE